jgi:hypothetical protein
MRKPAPPFRAPGAIAARRGSIHLAMGQAMFAEAGGGLVNGPASAPAKPVEENQDAVLLTPSKE